MGARLRGVPLVVGPVRGAVRTRQAGGPRVPEFPAAPATAETMATNTEARPDIATFLESVREDTGALVAGPSVPVIRPAVRAAVTGITGAVKPVPPAPVAVGPRGVGPAQTAPIPALMAAPTGVLHPEPRQRVVGVMAAKGPTPVVVTAAPPASSPGVVPEGRRRADTVLFARRIRRGLDAA